MFFGDFVLAKATKSGVRVNALAKEMDLESKDILSKLKAEGLDWAHNHMSTLTYGQAETVKEWYRTGQPRRRRRQGRRRKRRGCVGSRRVRQVPVRAQRQEKRPKKEATSPLPKRLRTKPATKQPTTDEGESEAITVAAPTPPIAERHPVHRARTEHVETPSTPATEAPSMRLTPHVVPAPALSRRPRRLSPLRPPKSPPKRPPRLRRLPPLRRQLPSLPPPRVPGRTRWTESVRPSNVPTVTLANRSTTAPVARAQPFVPKPAQIQGPRVVREEKPDVVATPAPSPGSRRRPRDQHRPQHRTPRKRGRGVKRTDDEEEAEKKKGSGPAPPSPPADAGPTGVAAKPTKSSASSPTPTSSSARNASSRPPSRAKSSTATSRPAPTAAPTSRPRAPQDKGEPIELEQPITVRTLSAAMGIKVNELLGKLMRQGRDGQHQRYASNSTSRRRSRWNTAWNCSLSVRRLWSRRSPKSSPAARATRPTSSPVRRS